MRRSTPHGSNGSSLASCLLALAAAAALSAGCERHIEEPAPARPLDPTSVAHVPQPTATATSTAAAADQGIPAGRCVRPTPATPIRPTPPGPDPRCPKDTGTPPKLRSAKVSFPDANGASVAVEVAERDEDRQRGLMYRKQMPEDRGMIFLFEEKEEHSFWMQNTCIPLDMLFIDGDGLIVGIEENVPTLNEDPRSVGCPSKYVLEVNAGWTRAHGVKAGQWVKIEGL